MVSYLLYRIAALLIHFVPRRSAERFAVIIAFFFYSFRKRIRKNIRSNFDALGMTGARTFTVFKTFSRTISDFLRLSDSTGDSLTAECSISGREHLDAVLGEGKGAILFCPHLGPWELGGAYLASLGYRIHAVALEHPSPRVTRFFSERRTAWGIVDYSLGECSAKMIRALRNGGVVVLLVDRNFSGRGIGVEFFGRDVVLPKGHIVLSMRTNAALMPCCCYYDESGKMIVVIDAPITPGSGADPRHIGHLCIGKIEEYIRAHPEQWYAFDHLWPE
jgi:lauroyl/myristoyl acyltransferase